METVIVLVLGIALGTVLGYVLVPARASRSRRGEPSRPDLARAWQEGFDAGSAAAVARVPGPPAVTVPPSPSRTPSPTSSRTPSPTSSPSSTGTPAPETGVAGPPVPAAPSLERGPNPPTGPVAPLAPTAPAGSPAPPARPVSPARAAARPEDTAAARERRDRRNVNITLYTACLLLVAAASLFIGAALPVTARVTGLAVVVGLFYLGGLVVHAVGRTVRPAAVAFTGTGLALVPVLGIALDALVLHDPGLSWLITSALGTVMLGVAAVRLDSTVVAYLAVPFLLSTVMASGAVVQRGMVWALIAWIGLATLMAWSTADAETADATSTARLRWLPRPLSAALARTHQWITPGAVLAALVVGLWVEPVQMLLLLLAASAYYATVAVIGPRRFRLAASYGVRVGLLLALVAWAAMLDWSLPHMLTGVVAYLCVQVPLTWFARGRGGFLPDGPPAHADRMAALGTAGVLAAAVQAGAWARADGPWLMDGFSGALAGLVLTVAVLSVASVRTSADPITGLGWQAATPLALVPVAWGWLPGVGAGERPWGGEVSLAVVVVLQLVIGAVLRGAPGHGPARTGRWDGLVAPHGAALAGVALVYLLAERWTAEGAPPLVAGLAALAWATITAVAQRPATRGRSPWAPGVALVAWGVATVLSLALLGGAERTAAGGPSGALLAGWHALLLVTAGAGLWWLVRGLPATLPPGTAGRIAVLAVSGLVLAMTVLLLSTAEGEWHSVVGLAVVAAWLVAVAVLTRGRLPRPLRAGVLLAGQGTSALLVTDVVDLVEGDGSAMRAAAAVALVVGLALRSRFADRLEGLGSGATSAWIVTAALGGLWLVESATGADRAALMVMAATVMVAGLVLRSACGGHWAVLGGILAAVLAASPVLRSAGGWLPTALVPTSAASALLVILALAAAGMEIAAARTGPVRGSVATPDSRQGGDVAPGRRAVPEGGAASGGGAVGGWPGWVGDLGLFRPVALTVSWGLAVLLGLVAGPGREPHPGVLGVAAAAAALLCYLLARTRRMPVLLGGTVLGVPVSATLLLQWWNDRGLWAPDEAWSPLPTAVLTAVALGLWARRDAAVGDSRCRPAVLWQGGLAIALLLAVAAVLRVPLHAGMPHDAVAWAGCALVAAGSWLAAGAVGRTPPGDRGPGAGRARWVLGGRDVAVLVTYGAAARAWWQDAEPDHPGQALWWTVQVLVVLLAGMGLWHGHGHGRRADRGHAFLLAAATVFTLAATSVLAGGTAMMQLTVLAGFSLLVVLGLLERRQPLTWWGAAGVALSVLWYLRDYTYVYLALLGAALIVLAVWQLRRRGRADQAKDQAREQAGADG